MRPRVLTFFYLLPLMLFGSAAGRAGEPRVADERYRLELVAKDPAIVTPIGMAFDRQGRLLVIESHTHLRAKNYNGPASDRIRILSNSKGDGRLVAWSTFAEGFRHAMNLLVRPDGAVYVVTRHNVVLLHDTHHNAVADKQDVIARLESADDYPHNGLSGVTLHPDGKHLLLGFGENHGLPYRFVGADGTSVAGHDGAGVIFQCTLDGGDVRKLASGFWNPFGLCSVPDGRVFAVDNDPDAAPFCRLLQIVCDGDYGFKFQYGRAGTHPLQAWNGELPGTLPMVTGIGEAPTAIMPFGGALWVASWGDHRIERYRLYPRGASFGANREVIVQGDSDFRPTGMAAAPDGSIYFGDWVLKDYPVHGRGRIWRLTVPRREAGRSFPESKNGSLANLPPGIASIKRLLQSNDPFEHAAGVSGLVRTAGWDYDSLKMSDSPRVRLGALEATRTSSRNFDRKQLIAALQDPSADVRLYAVRWIADERMTELKDDVARLLEGSQLDRPYYLAVLAAIDWLDHEPGLRGTQFSDQLLVRELENPHRSPELHALALSMLKPSDKFLTLARLQGYLDSNNAALQMEAVRTLAQQSSPQGRQILAKIAGDEKLGDDLRAEAIVGLAADAAQNRRLLEKLAASNRITLKNEAIRSLRLVGLRNPPPEIKPQAENVAAWSNLLTRPGDAAAGRRLFFSPAGPRCSVCHKYAGRGGNVGPDLTEIGHSTPRDKIITSILQPSQEIAPDYQAWVLVTDDGKTWLGLRQPKPGDDGKEDYIDSAGKLFTLPSSSIEERRVATKSIMPDNLQASLSIDDLRDLVTFLTSRPNANSKSE